MTGTAVPRGQGHPPGGGGYYPPGGYYPGGGYWGSGYYPYWSYYYPYYGFGAWGGGFWYWDWFWGSYGGYGGYGSYYTVRYDDTGAIRLKVKPREAQVFVDGYYVGVVDEFDGTFQRLHVERGPHRIEIRLEGFETLSFDVRAIFDHTITLQGELKPVQK